MSKAGIPAIEGGSPVRAERLPFFRPSHGEAEIEAVVETLRSGWLTVGPRVQQFREAFLAATGLTHGRPLGSCTAGLFLALESLGIGEGDEVITTPNTFVASVNVIHHAGATPVLADIEQETFGLDPARVEAAITPRTRAVLAVHYGGQCCRIEAIREICDAKGLLLIEDCAHAFGAEASGRHAGSLGDAAAFSFYVTKNLSTGEGGFLACRDEAVESEIGLLSLHGMDHDAWKRYGDRGSWYYEVKRFGYKCNMTDVQAALGLVQLARAAELQAARARAAGRYLERLADEDLIILPETRAGGVHSWHLFVPRLRLEGLSVSRDRFLEALAAENIGLSLHFIPIHHHPVHAEFFGDIRAALPQSEDFYRRCFSLPLFPDMTEADVDSACAAVSKLLSHYRR